MNRRPGHVTVTVETGYCSFCGRPRNLRSEAHQLGTLVRTILTCETCHRTLSSTIGVATEEPAATAEVQASPPPAAAPPAAPTSRETKPRAKRAPATAAARSAKAPAKPKTSAKRTTTKKK